MATPLTRHYAEFATALAGQSLSQAKLDVVRLGFTDVSGVILAALREDMVARLTRFARAQGGTPR